jgi:hypothetical protein
MKLFSQSFGYAMRITAIYLVVGAIWIFFSDRFLGTIINDSQLLIQAQTYKGWFFVLITSILLFILIKESTSSLIESKEKAEKAFHEKQVLLTELHHRVKNNLAVICSLIDLHAGSLDKSDAKDLREIQYRIHTLADIEEILYQNEDMSSIPFHKYMETSTSELNESSDINISPNSQFDEFYLNINQAVPLGLLLNEIFSQLRINPHLIQNDSIDICLTCKSESQRVHLCVQFDNISPVLLSTLTGDQIEATLMELYIRQLQASFNWTQKNGSIIFEVDFEKSDTERKLSFEHKSETQ